MNNTTATAARLSVLAAAILALTLVTTSCSFSPGNPKPAERMINLGFEDVVINDPGHLPGLVAKINDIDATAVSISVGRTDWAAFPWETHQDRVADEVRKTGRDYVSETINALRTSPSGQDRDIVLTIDALLGRALEQEPALAGINPQGEASSSFAGVAALRTGRAGQRLVEMATDVAARYQPTAINLTELMFDDYTFGPADLDDFRKATGKTAWPRTREDNIDTANSDITRWRTEAMSSLVERIAGAVRPLGVAVEMDVRAPLTDANQDRADSGHDYTMLLQHADRLHVWDYMGLRRQGAPGTRELARAAKTRDPERISLSIGLWSQDGVISPEQFRQTLANASAEGALALSVTPASLMTEQHWKVLKQSWK